MSQGYRICSRTVMDTVADPDITFDKNGISNYCFEHEQKSKLRMFDHNPRLLEEIINKIRTAGKGKEYDCLIGISGGVDSTYVAYKVKELGLRPLAIHFDNGWNSELAVKNIENTLNKLKIDLITYVIDWEEFRSLQLAFLRSSTPDGEIPTDHAIFALFFKLANEKGIKYIINGNNFETESIMPATWSYGHIDWRYIRSVNKLYGTSDLKRYPTITPLKYFYFTFIKGIRIVSLLNYLRYDKAEAMNILQNKLDWKYYGGKHYESIYTRFYQGYILPEKFKIDKRKAHISSLILSGQLTREQGLEELKKPIYPEELLKADKTFVIKKLGLTPEEFDKIMTSPNKTFLDYPNQYALLGKMRKLLNTLRGKGLAYS